MSCGMPHVWFIVNVLCRPMCCVLCIMQQTEVVAEMETWLRQLKTLSLSLGTWRRRRYALANVMTHKRELERHPITSSWWTESTDRLFIELSVNRDWNSCLQETGVWIKNISVRWRSTIPLTFFIPWSSFSLFRVNCSLVTNSSYRPMIER